MIKVNLYTVAYPAPADDEDDYCPDGELVNKEQRVVSFRELCDLMDMHSECSCCPASGDVNEWVTARDDDYIAGGFTENTMHFARENAPRAAKYWAKAMRAAGFVKGRA